MNKNREDFMWYSTFVKMPGELCSFEERAWHEKGKTAHSASNWGKHALFWCLAHKRKPLTAP
jgi:hypothetical protein